MASNDYAFVTRWLVTATCPQIYDILIQGKEFTRWWSDVYLEVTETDSGGVHGLGKAANLLTKGKLPYRLRWSMRIVEVNYPHGFKLEAKGDFVGTGTWQFVQASSQVDIRFCWVLRAEKPLLKYLSFLMKPVFKANHLWAMARGLDGLQRELLRLNSNQ